MTRKVGRPTKYKPEYCKKIVEIMSQGASLCEVAAELNVEQDTLNNWTKEHKEFFGAKKRGIELSKSWWEKHGRIQLENPKFNATLWYMNMKNRFGWRDKQEINANVSGDVTFRIEYPKDEADN